ncbi:MAG: hypothetical protein H7Z43_04825 [Clostridia bacterium]|nr:hypothetical protein [Deltaproteobacteria bacterium]
MAKFKTDSTLKFQTTKDAEIESTSFAAGADVKIVHEWGNRFLVRASDGHYYNVPKEQIEK